MNDLAQLYREQLLAAGFQESEIYAHRYFKTTSALTAFILNLKVTDDTIELMFGYASTAFTRFPGCENHLIESGVCNEEINIREKLIIRSKAEEETAGQQVLEMYNRYLHAEKEELLNLAKVKRKSFIQQIAVKLKPLGFRKKANSWSKTLERDYYLTFNAQKSAFSDEYYFNIYIGKTGTNRFGDCYHIRVFPRGMCPMDWQALSADEFELFLNRAVVPALEQIINTPLFQLGTLPSIWPHCICDRKKCEPCWVEKNVWEAKADSENVSE